METFLDYMKTPWISSDLSAWYLFQPNCLVWTVSQRTYNSVEQVSTSVLGDLETCRWLAGRWKVMATLSLTHTSWINWVLTYWSSISLPLAFLANLTYSSSFFLTLVSCTNMQSDVKIKQKLMTVNMCKISMDDLKYTCCTARYCKEIRDGKLRELRAREANPKLAFNLFEHVAHETNPSCQTQCLSPWQSHTAYLNGVQQSNSKRCMRITSHLSVDKQKGVMLKKHPT